MNEEEKPKYSGRPLTEEELKDWQKAFTDIEDCIENLEKEEKWLKNTIAEKIPKNILSVSESIL